MAKKSGLDKLTDIWEQVEKAKLDEADFIFLVSVLVYSRYEHLTGMLGALEYTKLACIRKLEGPNANR